jgi:4-aminobutyrate aminotransferase
MSPVKGCTAGAKVYRASPFAITSSSFSFNTNNNNAIRTYTTPSKPVSASPAYATQSNDQDSNNDMPAPVRTQQQWADFGKAHVTHGLGRLREEVMVKGEGVWLYNADGQKYLDFTAGIGVTNLGQYVDTTAILLAIYSVILPQSYDGSS